MTVFALALPLAAILLPALASGLARAGAPESRGLWPLLGLGMAYAGGFGTLLGAARMRRPDGVGPRQLAHELGGAVIVVLAVFAGALAAHIVLAEVAPDLPPARADAERLEQVVSNLLGDAVRHTPPGGMVAATVTAEPEAVRGEGRDTGEGIAPEELPHVF